MKLNLGCGRDIRPGYVNVDFVEPCDMLVDLSKMPWPWQDGTADEILMLDFLEHFPYRQTDTLIAECWRILKPGGKLVIQVPDIDHCSRAMLFRSPFLCNRCGWEFPETDLRANFFICGKCNQHWRDIALAAAHRLHGGQDRNGNWHFMCFSQLLLREMLYKAGFADPVELEKEHQWKNWNFKVQYTKSDDVWGDIG